MAPRRTRAKPINREGSGLRRTSAPLQPELKVGPASGSAQERDTMRFRVYRALARGLMAGMFKPGEAVTLRTLAHRLGTSAMPVREAVSRLIAERHWFFC